MKNDEFIHYFKHFVIIDLFWKTIFISLFKKVLNICWWKWTVYKNSLFWTVFGLVSINFDQFCCGVKWEHSSFSFFLSFSNSEWRDGSWQFWDHLKQDSLCWQRIPTKTIKTVCLFKRPNKSPWRSYPSQRLLILNTMQY